MQMRKIQQGWIHSESIVGSGIDLKSIGGFADETKYLVANHMI